eukprot:TRINITY_DN4058_c0_g1_i1.p1 TRINITY_DN4058_c0_g1~~TRINITY_DN4058_c0_g1_i1.p1  ORF type:complete len:348 (-),score=42.75 TRINITY_DN4058_c0_g1_i1:64-1107(-)
MPTMPLQSPSFSVPINGNDRTISPPLIPRNNMVSQSNTGFTPGHSRKASGGGGATTPMHEFLIVDGQAVKRTDSGLIPMSNLEIKGYHTILVEKKSKVERRLEACRLDVSKHKKEWNKVKGTRFVPDLQMIALAHREITKQSQSLEKHFGMSLPYTPDVMMAKMLMESHTRIDKDLARELSAIAGSAASAVANVERLGRDLLNISAQEREFASILQPEMEDEELTNLDEPSWMSSESQDYRTPRQIQTGYPLDRPPPPVHGARVDNTLYHEYGPSYHFNFHGPDSSYSTSPTHNRTSAFTSEPDDELSRVRPIKPKNPPRSYESIHGNSDTSAVFQSPRSAFDLISN